MARGRGRGRVCACPDRFAMPTLPSRWPPRRPPGGMSAQALHRRCHTFPGRGVTMSAQNGMSRRHALRMAVAIGGLVMSGGSRAEASKRIEQLAPELEKIISPSEPIQELADGFGGPLGPAEGPVWWKEGGYLLFSDIHNNRRMKYEPGKGVSVFLEPTNRANGLTRDLQGRLIACEHDTRRVTRQELDGSLTVIANSFQGRRLNRPNDVAVQSDGSI